MLRGVEMAFGLEEGSLPTPLFMRVQLWFCLMTVSYHIYNIPCYSIFIAVSILIFLLIPKGFMGRGAALPVNTPNIPCIFDANGRVGICGDWLLGSNLQAAALSGMAMANHVCLILE